MLVLHEYEPEVNITNMMDDNACKFILADVYKIQAKKWHIARGLFEVHKRLIVPNVGLKIEKPLYNSLYSSRILRVANLNELGLRLEAINHVYAIVNKLEFSTTDDKVTMRLHYLEDTTIYHASLALFRQETIDEFLKDL